MNGKEQEKELGKMSKDELLSYKNSLLEKMKNPEITEALQDMLLIDLQNTDDEINSRD